MECFIPTRNNRNLTKLNTSVAAVLNNTGVLLQKRCNLYEAESFFVEALRTLHDAYVQEDNALHQLYTRLQEKTLLLKRMNLIDVCHRRYDDSDKRQKSYLEQAVLNHVMIQQGLMETLSIAIDEDNVAIDDNIGSSIFIMHNLGIIQIQLGEHEKALIFFRSAVALMPVDFEFDSVTAAPVLVSCLHLAGLLSYFQPGDHDKEAMDMLMFAMQKGQMTFDNHICIARTLSTIGRMLMERGYVIDSMTTVNEAFRMFEFCLLQIASETERDLCNDAARAA